MLLLNAAVSAACTLHGQDLPVAVEQLIADFELREPGAPESEIWSFEYRDETVYYLPRAHLCCDIPSVVYDAAGKQVCQPDGGIAGFGDGKCTDFAVARSGGVRLWPLAATRTNA